jgi:hypothetical protein
MNMHFDHGQFAIQEEDIQYHGWRSRWRFLLRAFCLCVIALIGASYADSQNRQSQHSWPTMGEFVAADRGWQTVADLGLSGQELNEVQRITAAWIEKHCGHKGEGKQRAAKLSAKRIQLQVSGANQIVVEEASDWEGDSESCSCAPKLNCRRWVLNFQEGKATTLLEYNALGIDLLKTSNRGHFDIATISNRKVGAFDLTVWKFDGVRYQPFRCASMHYAPDAINGDPVVDGIDKTAVLSEHPCLLPNR